MTKLLNPLPPRGTLGMDVLNRIKDLLLTGRVMPGERLSLRSMAEALGVSMMPVREAVYRLISDQALEVAPNRSIRVPVMSAEQFDEITGIRLLIEGYAVREAVAHVTPALVQSLRDLNQELALRMSEGGDSLGKAVLVNKALHFSLYETAHMPMLMKIIESSWLRIGPVLNYDLRSGSERTENQTAVGHHGRMIDALERADADAAAAALQDDIKSAYCYIVEKQWPKKAPDVSVQSALS